MNGGHFVLFVMIWMIVGFAAIGWILHFPPKDKDKQ